MTTTKTSEDRIALSLCPWQAAALHNPYTHFAMVCGIAVGKTFTGAQFALKMIIEHPELTGLIGANSYDQLSQATLREFMYWLDHFQIEYVIDRQPPPSWGEPRKFKEYHNVMSVRNNGHVTYIFTRVMSDGDALRGIEFSWYWIDESRDTPLNTHDIILSRLRESTVVKGLVTTTPAGEDWVWRRFVKGRDKKLYGCIHVKTVQSVRYGIITPEFYRALRQSYSPNMAAQELDAKHVTVLTGRAFYTCDERNKLTPGWEPNPDWPLVVAMDFNFQPAPMVWCVGQYDPLEEHIRWFDELSDVEISSREMARRLAAKYGNWFLRIFGDASGTRGTTSNAGETDYMQIADELTMANVMFSIEVEQANPAVKDRVENTCRMLRNADDQVSMWVDPDRCPLLWRDYNRVVWGPGGKLSPPKTEKGLGDEASQYTHAGDGTGYAIYKLSPPRGGAATIGRKVESQFSRIAREES